MGYFLTTQRSNALGYSLESARVWLLLQSLRRGLSACDARHWERGRSNILLNLSFTLDTCQRFKVSQVSGSTRDGKPKSFRSRKSPTRGSPRIVAKVRESARVQQKVVFSRLLTLPNVVIAGHQAFLTKEALEHIAPR
jgi:hypothetical protein